jgi:Arc/MetJ family transcription regulator
MIPPEQHTEIRRLYYGEHWKVGTIAAALGVHHETVRAALVKRPDPDPVPLTVAVATTSQALRALCGRRSLDPPCAAEKADSQDVVQESNSVYTGCMKTTVDIPDDELADAIRFTKARTKREAIVTAITEFNRRRRMAQLVRRAGTCPDLMSVEDVRQMRRRS